MNNSDSSDTDTSDTDTSDSTPHIPSSDDADPDVQSTPGGLAEELEQEAEERDAEVGPEAADAH